MEKKNLLIYAHYYAPDVASTGQLLQDLAEGMEDDFRVTVICAVPSYGGNVREEYKKKRFYKENINGVKVIRVKVPGFRKTSKYLRIKNLAAYYMNSKKATRMIGCQDYILAISQPPILGGMLGVYGKNKIRTVKGKQPKYLYCIQDFNPEQIEAVGYFKNRLLMEFLRRIDNHSCRKADMVVTVGRDLVETLKNRFINQTVPRYEMINNWINEDEVYPLESNCQPVKQLRERYDLVDKFIIMYSGNIGLYYDLRGLIRVIEKVKGMKTPDGRDVAFVFAGAGSELEYLKGYKERHGLNHVVFIPYQDKEELINSLNMADVHLCVNAKGIKGVSCPSKFYGIVGVGKPVLGVLEKGSEIQMLIEEIGCGRVSEPGDYGRILSNVKWFIKNAGSEKLTEMGNRGYEYCIKHLTKRMATQKYARLLLSI